MKKTEIVAAIIGLVLSIATYWGTLYFPKFPTPLAGPEFFPRLLAFVLAILSLVFLFQALMKKEARKEGEVDAEPRQKVFWRMILAMGVSVLYFLGLRIFGFLICTFSYFAFLMLLMQTKKRIIKTIIWSAATTAVTYVAFGMVLRATLPTGIIFR
jgi:hypothetical protein